MYKCEFFVCGCGCVSVTSGRGHARMWSCVFIWVWLIAIGIAVVLSRKRAINGQTMIENRENYPWDTWEIIFHISFPNIPAPLLYVCMKIISPSDSRFSSRYTQRENSHQAIGLNGRAVKLFVRRSLVFRFESHQNLWKKTGKSRNSFMKKSVCLCGQIELENASDFHILSCFPHFSTLKVFFSYMKISIFGSLIQHICTKLSLNLPHSFKVRLSTVISPASGGEGRGFQFKT